MAFSLDKKEKKEADRQRLDFEATQNAVGFFSALLEVVKRNPKLRKQIFNENDENNRGSNTADKA